MQLDPSLIFISIFQAHRKVLKFIFSCILAILIVLFIDLSHFKYLSIISFVRNRYQRVPNIWSPSLFSLVRSGQVEGVSIYIFMDCDHLPIVSCYRFITFLSFNNQGRRKHFRLPYSQNSSLFLCTFQVGKRMYYSTFLERIFLNRNRFKKSSVFFDIVSFLVVMILRYFQ